MARKKKQDDDYPGELRATLGPDTVFKEAPVAESPTVPLTKDIPSLERDPLASDADVCECHHARGRHRGGKDDCEGHGSGQPCDTRCTFFLLALGAAADHPAATFEPEPEASVETPAQQKAEEPRPEPVAVDDKDLYPRAPADLDIDKLTKVKRQITTELDDAARAEMGGKLADLVVELADERAAADKTRKALKAAEKAIEERITRAAEAFHTGSLRVDVECFELPNVKDGRVEIYRLDNRVFLESRPFSNGEKESALAASLVQTEMFPAEETPIGANTMPTTPIAREHECKDCGHAQEFHGKDHRPDGCIVDGCPCRGFVPMDPVAEEPTPEEIEAAGEDEEGSKAA